MWNRIDPYDMLMVLQQRINTLEEQNMELQHNQMHMSNLINRQNKLIKDCQIANKNLNDFVNHWVLAGINK